MKKVWVTGAHGFLGRNLCRQLGKDGFYVVGIGHGHWSPGEAKKFGLNRWIFSDITLAALYELESETGIPEAIYHTAGSGSVAHSLSNPHLDYQRTVQTTLDVLEFIRLKSPQTTVVYPSSAAVYGAVNKGSIPEASPFNPVSPYGVHKQMAELLCQSYNKHFNVKAVVVRLFSIYGIGLMKQLLWDLCRKIEDGREVILYGTGEEVRDWIHVEDAVNLLIKVASLAGEKFMLLNGGTGDGVTVAQIADEIRKRFGEEKKIQFNGVVRNGDPRYYQAAVERAESLGWKPNHDWRSGIMEYVDWYKSMRGLS